MRKELVIAALFTGYVAICLVVAYLCRLGVAWWDSL